MILKRRFPNFVDIGPEHWTEHEVNSLDDVLTLEWIKNWDTLYYGNNNPYLNATKWPYHLIGTIEHERVYIVIGLFNGDPSILGLNEHIRKNKL